MQNILEKRGAGFSLFLLLKSEVIGMGKHTKQSFMIRRFTMWKSIALKEGLLRTSRGVLRACVSLDGCANRN